MSNTIIRQYPFNEKLLNTLGGDSKEINWPVVYQLFNNSSIYIGESTNLSIRMKQHFQNPEKSSLNHVAVVYNDEFNKSVTLDLESTLIQWFTGDGKYKILNKNEGLADRDYYDRERYRDVFVRIWEQLRSLNVADKSVKDIENSGLFKFSPYKNLKGSQIEVIKSVLTELIYGFKNNESTISVIGGDEGTGKTIVLMYLAKLIRDIQDYSYSEDEELNPDFEEYFKGMYRNSLNNKTIAIVIPNQSLRGSMTKIFKSINNMDNVDLLSPIEFGSIHKNYDITFVDEAHLLKISNQEVHKANREKVDKINTELFDDNLNHTELDWIIKKSKNVIMVYGDQRIKPNNISIMDLSKYDFKEYILKSQIRSNGGDLFIDYIKAIFSSTPPIRKINFENFEFKLFKDFKNFTNDISERENEFGLSRLVAGFAWEWKSKKNKEAYDIVIDGIGLRWNSVLSDFIGSKNSINEVGSIYTIQGNDLNYCGVIIGFDLRYDPIKKTIYLDKKNYKDRGAKKRNRIQIEKDVEITDDELLDQVIRIYRILINRSIKGTYLYVCDENLREYLSKYVDVKC